MYINSGYPYLDYTEQTHNNKSIHKRFGCLT